jgi:hypothetical protein
MLSRMAREDARARAQAAVRGLRLALTRAADAHHRAAELEDRAAELFAELGDERRAEEHRERARRQRVGAADDQARADELI